MSILSVALQQLAMDFDEIAYLGRRRALQELEFVPARVKVRDFVSGRFQLRLQIENFRARFPIKIRRSKRGLQIRYLGFRQRDTLKSPNRTQFAS